MKPKSMSIVRHTRNYEAMLQFYRDTLEMKPAESWEEPGNRGTLLSPGEKVGNTFIEVIELGNEAVSGVKPVNVVLSVEVEDVNHWHDHLAAKGVKIARGLKVTSWGHRSFGVDDPDGLRIWFYEDLNISGDEGH